MKKLNDLISREKASIVVIKGRRRIGKSCLAKEFAKDKIFVPFSGIAPIEQVSSQDQRDTFSKQLAQNFNVPFVRFDDWYDVFLHMVKHLPKEKKTVLLFDEISWMGSKDQTFIPKLKNLWDLVLQDYSNLILIFCGSVSTWIEENIINSTAFFGRISLYMTLQELSLKESYEFLAVKGFKQSIYETYKLLAVTGGVPWYLEQIIGNQSADDNIKRLCFDPDGILVKEFDRIFYDLFMGKGHVYKKIVNLLAEGMKDLATIKQSLGYPAGGSMSLYLKDLVISGYVDQNYAWSIKTGKVGKQNLYRLSDNYLRFYVKYIEPNLPKIQKSSYNDFALSGLPGWETMMGFQVENLLLKNRHLLLKILGIQPQDIVADNPYIQRSTSRQQGCQIDYLIQTHAHNLFVCEFKFSKKEVGLSVIETMKDKIKRFSAPKGFGICPVLVHLSGVSDAVYDAGYFYKIIDIEDFLTVS